MESRISRSRLALAGVCLALAVWASAPGWSCVVHLTPSRDTTLYEPELEEDQLGNGAGQFLFAGNNGAGRSRRALLHFDVGRDLPPLAVVRTVTLTLQMSRTNALVEPVAIWRLLRDWGEGDSVGIAGEGAGGIPANGDATWRHTFFPGTDWISDGGDHEPFVQTATRQVGGIGSYTWGSTPTMVADVTAWRNTPAQNFGWILIGNESTPVTAKRFNSRNNDDPATWPQLSIEFSLPADSPGAVPDGGPVAGTPLSVDKAGVDVSLSWGHSCFSTDEDYIVYEGPLDGTFQAHEARVCSTGGATAESFTPAPGSTYYLIVPRSADREGSYGTRSDGEQRTPGSGCQLLQEFDTCS